MKPILYLLLLSTFTVNAQKWAKNFDFVDECVCGLSLVGKDHKVGFTDHNVNIIVPLIYDEGLSFREGYTAVRKGEKWLYLDSTGKAITEAIFGDAYSFHDGLAAAMKGNSYGYIDYTG